jgi:hypothetical protein
MKTRYLAWLLLPAVAFTGCATMKKIIGVRDPGEPSVVIKSAETRWLLIKNPRYGDVPSEPEYVWVEEDKRPWTTRWGIPQRAAIAPPEIVARYGSPPGGGKISPQQGLPYQVPAAGERAPVAVVAKPAPGTPAPAVETPKRGYVVWADTTRIVIDLTSQDGVRPGSLVSLRRNRIPIVHPITGEVLGELDEEIATARVTETREKFSVAEIQTVAPGAQVQVKDRAVPK